MADGCTRPLIQHLEDVLRTHALSAMAMYEQGEQDNVTGQAQLATAIGHSNLPIPAGIMQAYTIHRISWRHACRSCTVSRQQQLSSAKQKCSRCSESTSSSWVC